jgi:hypothetical protein
MQTRHGQEEMAQAQQVQRRRKKVFTNAALMQTLQQCSAEGKEEEKMQGSGIVPSRRSYDNGSNEW